MYTYTVQQLSVMYLPKIIWIITTSHSSQYFIVLSFVSQFCNFVLSPSQAACISFFKIPNKLENLFTQTSPVKHTGKSDPTRLPKQPTQEKLTRYPVFYHPVMARSSLQPHLSQECPPFWSELLMTSVSLDIFVIIGSFMINVGQFGA